MGLKKEFEKVKTSSKLQHKNFDAVCVFCAEEVDLKGENRQRILEGLSLCQELKKPFIFLGTKSHNQNLSSYLKKKNVAIEVLYPIKREHASTRTQIKDLSEFLSKNPQDNILIVTHAYHVPRTVRYCKKYFTKNVQYEFWPIGKVQDQQKQVEREIKKIIKYKTQGDL